MGLRLERGPGDASLQKSRVGSNQRRMFNEELVLFHKSLEVRGIDASVSRDWSKATVQEMFGIWVFLNAIRCLGPETKLRE